MKKKELEDKTLDFLLEKSNHQLSVILTGFDEAKKTSHIHLGITTFLFTVIIGVIKSMETDWYSLLFIIPVFGILISYYKIVNNLYAVRLPIGKILDWYESTLSDPIIKVKETELADNLDSIKKIKEGTALKNRIIKIVGNINFFSLLITVTLIIIKVILSLHNI